MSTKVAALVVAVAAVAATAGFFIGRSTAPESVVDPRFKTQIDFVDPFDAANRAPVAQAGPSPSQSTLPSPDAAAVAAAIDRQTAQQRQAEAAAQYDRLTAPSEN